MKSDLASIFAGPNPSSLATAPPRGSDRARRRWKLLANAVRAFGQPTSRSTPSGGDPSPTVSSARGPIRTGLASDGVGTSSSYRASEAVVVCLPGDIPPGSFEGTVGPTLIEFFLHHDVCRMEKDARKSQELLIQHPWVLFLHALFDDAHPLAFLDKEHTQAALADMAKFHDLVVPILQSAGEAADPNFARIALANLATLRPDAWGLLACHANSATQLKFLAKCLAILTVSRLADEGSFVSGAARAARVAELLTGSGTWSPSPLGLAAAKHFIGDVMLALAARDTASDKSRAVFAGLIFFEPCLKRMRGGFVSAAESILGRTQAGRSSLFLATLRALSAVAEGASCADPWEVLAPLAPHTKEGLLHMPFVFGLFVGIYVKAFPDEGGSTAFSSADAKAKVEQWAPSANERGSLVMTLGGIERQWASFSRQWDINGKFPTNLMLVCWLDAPKTTYVGGCVRSRAYTVPLSSQRARRATIG